MLKLENYSVAYGESTVISDLNLNIKKNEIVALLGRNGMGKTTLMKSIIGMVKSKSGKVILDGTDLTPLKSYQRVAAGVGFVPQGRMIFSTMSVKENIETGLTVTGSNVIPEYLYETFPILKEFTKRKGGNLSGGQQQQLAIARALASNPKLLILDEPTEGIQPNIIKDMAKTLRKIRDDRGLTIFVSEQVLSFALDVADRIVVIEKGSIVYDAPREETDAQLVTKFLSV
ncbi:MAG: urea ABC transporter ATP-binding subunit UrtE [Succinivibrio sp.]|nr:urea ABC transporter ATP-binding subunit UrtE [Succinivibrio sp.]